VRALLDALQGSEAACQGVKTFFGARERVELVLGYKPHFDVAGTVENWRRYLMAHERRSVRAPEDLDALQGSEAAFQGVKAFLVLVNG